jgi:3-dehydroquinate synthetase
MSRDKKATAGAVRFVLLEALGRATMRSDITDADLRAAIES